MATKALAEILYPSGNSPSTAVLFAEILAEFEGPEKLLHKALREVTAILAGLTARSLHKSERILAQLLML